MPPSEYRQDSLTHVLIGDVDSAMSRVKENNTASHRRDLIRTVFSAIEGLHWQLKQDMLRHTHGGAAQLSVHERAALMEETGDQPRLVRGVHTP